MTSNIPWFKLALVGTFIGVSALIGYAAVTRNAFASSETAETIESKDTIKPPTSTKPKPQKKKKPKTKTSSASDASKSKSTSSINEDPFGNALALIEKDVSVLNKLPPEVKQQVFYILLIRGETMVKESAGNEEILAKAVEYFVKAVGLVSQPAEVLMSYEQTLPEEIFKSIILSLQSVNIEKTRGYFESLRSETGLVRFDQVEGAQMTSPTAKSDSKEWVAVLAGDEVVSEGTVLMSEEPDVAMCTLKAETCCDFCFKTLTEIEEICHLADLSYCSAFCQSRARNSYGKYIENLKGTAAYAYQQLVKVVHETKVYAPLLLLRYISSLLEDELMKQKSSENDDGLDRGRFYLFAHYDYLRPAYRVPRDSDKAEAVLIRTILEPAHKDISEFLSDEIYVAMKSTVMFNGIGIEINAKQEEKAVGEEAELFTEESKISVNSEAPSKTLFSLKSVEPVRNSGNTAKSDFFGLYHSFAHISHSCDPNCQLICDKNVPRRLKLVARRSIKPAEKLTISFTGIERGCAKESLETDFYTKCSC